MGVGGAGDGDTCRPVVVGVGVNFWGVGKFPNQSSPDIRDGDGEGGGPTWATPGLGHGLGDDVGGGCCVGCHVEVDGTGAHVVMGGCRCCGGMTVGGIVVS